MSDSQGILLFTNDSSAGSASSDYDKDAFLDISLPASNNTGFSSTVTSNPLNGKFGNDGAPKWMAKTLFIKDLQRVEDRTLWVNGRATYKIIFDQSFPGVEGYVFGSVQLAGTAESRYVLINDNGDGCGVSGVIRRVQWLVRPVSGTATATPSTDGSNLTNINYGGYSGLGVSFATTKPIFEAYTTDTSNATHNIHDHRLVANNVSTLQLIGVTVYFNVTGDGVELFPGDTYVNKSLTSMSGATLSYPVGYSNFLGGWDGIYTTSNGVQGVTSSPIVGLGTNCSGASGTNLLSVSIGTGASFPVGTGVYIPSGTTYFLGQITNVSGDVLTVSPTLAFGLSNVCSALFQSGQSFVIDSTYFSPSWSWQPGVGGRTLTVSLYASEAPFSFSDPFLRYRIWGSTLGSWVGSSSAGFSGIGNTIGLNFPLTTDFLQVAGRFSALEFEFLVGTSALLSCSLAIDGVMFDSQSTVLDGPTVLRRVVMANAGMGWHSVLYSNTGSTNVLLSRVNAYEPKIWNGPSYGLLAQVSVGQTFTPRDAQNASLMAFGNITRVYAESVRANGASWKSTAEAGPGGRSISTTGSGDYAEFQYFGTQFALLGSAGTSTIMTINGTSTNPSFNAWNNASATLGFQSVQVTSKAGTLKMFGYDFLSPVGNVRSAQNYNSVSLLASMPRAFSQPSEPLNARLGDIWQSDVTNKIAYQKLYGGWERMFPADNGFPVLVAYRSTNQAISDSTATTVVADTVIIDSASAYVASTGIFTVPVGQGGLYEVHFTGVLQVTVSFNGTTKNWNVVFDVNAGATQYNGLIYVPPSAAFNAVFNSAQFINLVAGDAVKVQVTQNSGAPANVGGNVASRISFRRVK